MTRGGLSELEKHVPAGSSVLGALAYWRGLIERVGGLPRHRDLDPLDMPRHILPDLSLYWRGPDRRLLCRLAGSRLVNLIGFEPRGRYMDESLQPEASANRERLFHDCLDTRCPIFYRAVLVIEGRDHHTIIRVLLPVLDDAGELPCFVFGAMEVDDRKAVAPDGDGQPEPGRPITLLTGEPVAVARRG